MTDRPTPPPWAALGPLTALDGQVFTLRRDIDVPDEHVLTVGDWERPDEIADMVAAAPTWALLFRLGMQPRHTVTLAMAPSGVALMVTHWHDGAWTDFVLPLDAHGLPVMTAEQYRALAPLVGWPVAPAGEAAS